MDKKIFKYEDIKDKILSGIDLIANPVKQTLSPKGGNVLFENGYGSHFLSNDGETIAKNISVNDQIEEAVIDIIKQSSRRTNSEAGDGTTTSILLSQVLSKEGLKLKDEGVSWIEIRDNFNKMASVLVENISKRKRTISNDDDIRFVARISANNDDKIATDVLDIVKTAGEDGMVFLEGNQKPETEIIKDLGFMINSGVPYQELLTTAGNPVVRYKGVPVLVTDKKIYYPEEAETILRTIIKSGHKEVVVVAKDIVGEAVNVFVTNHQKGNVHVLLVKSDNKNEIEDLAAYLGCKVITEKTGSLVDKITIKDFVIANQVYADPQKTLITPSTSATKELKGLIKYLKDELKKDKDNQVFKKRLASLTNGVVTVKVGGATEMEVREKIYRYEDAVNATRSAMKHGYLVGGGISLLRAYNPDQYSGYMKGIAKKFTESVVRQIALNCGKHPDTVVENILSKSDLTYGYNALTDKFGDLLKEKVFDSYKVLELAIQNSVSVANILVSINNYIVNDLENEKGKKDKQD